MLSVVWFRSVSIELCAKSDTNWWWWPSIFVVILTCHSVNCYQFAYIVYYPVYTPVHSSACLLGFMSLWKRTGTIVEHRPVCFSLRLMSCSWDYRSRNDTTCAADTCHLPRWTWYWAANCVYILSQFSLVVRKADLSTETWELCIMESFYRLYRSLPRHLLCTWILADFWHC